MNRLVKKIALVAAMALCSCASRKHIGPLTQNAERLFPDGKYQHWVKIELPSSPSAAPKHFEFQGAVSLQPDAIMLVGLSPFNTTLFRLREDRKTGAIEVQSYVEALQKFEAQVKRFYPLLRDLLLIPRDGQGSGYRLIEKDPSGRPIRVEVPSTEFGSGLVLKIAKYDEHSIAQELELESPKLKLRVEVRGYEIP